MTEATRTEPLAPPVAARLADFARACKAATRAVSLYPAAHPAIGATLARLVEAGTRAVESGPLTVSVTPSGLLVEGRAALRPDPAIAELAVLLHEHLIGELRLVAPADADAWRSFLLLLAQPAADVQTQGGLARLWAVTGGEHLQVREVDYTEVLRAREAGIATRWEDILRHCLRGDAVDLDDEALQSLLDIAENPERLGELARQLDQRAGRSGDAERRTGALLLLLRRIADAIGRLRPDRGDLVLGNIASAAGELSPEVMLALIARRYDAPPPGSINVVDSMLTRITDATVGQFVARSIIESHGATERLAQAFQALVPDLAHRQRLLGDVRARVAESPLGRDETFEALWQSATDMLTSYKDAPFVSDAYGRELSNARVQAAAVERIADDPPETIAAWVATITDAAVREHDLVLQLDLLRIEGDPDRWRDLTEPVVACIEDLAVLGDFDAALPLVEALAREAGPEGRPSHRAAAGAAVERLTRGGLMTQVVVHLRTIDDEGFARVHALCHALGHVTIRSLAEALATEDRGHGFRRLTDLIVAFGSAGRDAAEKLKGSANPAVRRTAVYLLREFGGDDALPDLTSLLDDAEPNVQRDAVRAIALIGTAGAFSVLQQALTDGTDRQREAIIGAIGAMRDERAVPLFRHLVRQDSYRRTLQRAWLAAVEGLAAVGDDDAVRALGEALPRGEWWAPYRTAALRRAVAAALGRIGTPAAMQVLEAAATAGPRGARLVAREELTRARGRRPARDRRA